MSTSLLRAERLQLAHVVRMANQALTVSALRSWLANKYVMGSSPTSPDSLRVGAVISGPFLQTYLREVTGHRWQVEQELAFLADCRLFLSIPAAFVDLDTLLRVNPQMTVAHCLAYCKQVVAA
jgi:hypothetical protein